MKYTVVILLITFFFLEKCFSQHIALTNDSIIVQKYFIQKKEFSLPNTNVKDTNYIISSKKLTLKQRQTLYNFFKTPSNFVNKNPLPNEGIYVISCYKNGFNHETITYSPQFSKIVIRNQYRKGKASEHLIRLQTTCIKPSKKYILESIIKL